VRLVLLNGPPGIGKSTLSALHADRHPGTLNLDIDTMAPLVGGWQDLGGRVHEVLRPLALAMAAAHLRGGRDVVVPQYLARVDEIVAFSDVARQEGAAFREVVLFDSRERAVERFERRVPHDDPVVRQNHRVVDHGGGAARLGAMYDTLLEVVARRPGAVVVRSEPGAVEETYRLLAAAL
jgi:predicted ABC-type ATPase